MGRSNKYYYRNGNVYHGQMRGGRPHGKGRMDYANGDVYEGDFVHGAPNGQGKFVFEDGLYYEGSVESGLFRRVKGYGTFYIATGESYVGGMKNWRFHGEGEYRDENGKVTYKGEWRDGKRHGHGIKYYADGGRYEGEFRRGLRHGWGILYYPEGGDILRYEGNFKGGVPRGRGTYYRADGSVREVK